jgi:hypothetical protein
LESGTSHETVAAEMPLVATTPLGALGAVATGVTRLDGDESLLEPMALSAATVKEYAVPPSKFIMVQVVLSPSGVVHRLPPGVAVTT